MPEERLRDGYFYLDEFDSPDVPGSGKEIMKKSTIKMLNKVRHKVGFPLFVSSGVRSEAQNERVGGVSGSSHTRGWAVDLRISSSRDRFKVVQAAIEVGFTRIGIGKSFIHLDNDPKKPKEVMWLY